MFLSACESDHELRMLVCAEVREVSALAFRYERCRSIVIDRERETLDVELFGRSVEVEGRVDFVLVVFLYPEQVALIAVAHVV